MTQPLVALCNSGVKVSDAHLESIISSELEKRITTDRKVEDIQAFTKKNNNGGGTHE